MSKASNERRSGERRGRGLSSNKTLSDFLYSFWDRYFHDRPDLDRRKQPDRRKDSQGEPQEQNFVSRISFALGKFAARFKSNKNT
jgi:hypothetical protein